MEVTGRAVSVERGLEFFSLVGFGGWGYFISVIKEWVTSEGQRT